MSGPGQAGSGRSAKRANEELTVTETPARLPLTYLRTVDRSLLHRRSLAEVFITDSQQLSRSRYACAAQLPRSHAYYTDWPGGAGHIDPLLVLECCRQAETLGGHQYFGIDQDVRFIARSWSLRLPRLPRLPAGAPPELVIRAAVRNPRGRPGQVTALTYYLRVLRAGRPLGGARIDVGYLSAGAYARVRAARRAAAAPAPPPAGPAVDPELVGRASPANVLLSAPAFDDVSVQARIRVPLENPSLFDHPQDHLPGMVLMEAARQACLLAAGRLHRAAPGRLDLADADAAFTAYAELDRPATVRAELAGPAGPDGSCPMRVTVRQDRTRVADIAVTLRPAPGRAAAAPPRPERDGAVLARAGMTA
jgi:2-oxo-3-(phosphooxy)propyl 3-oxoalkanoate synthase